MARKNCTGVEGMAPHQGGYGRQICTTCGNSAFPTADGTLRKHAAKRIDERTRVACGIVFTAEQEAVFAANAA